MIVEVVEAEHVPSTRPDPKSEWRGEMGHVSVDECLVVLGPHGARVVGRHALEEETPTGSMDHHAEQAVVACADLLRSLEKPSVVLDSALDSGWEVRPGDASNHPVLLKARAVFLAQAIEMVVSDPEATRGHLTAGDQ
jgi:hypothetical protein